MARQKGHIAYVGSIGEMRHYKITGQQGYFAGLKGGPSAERIKTGEEFKRTRENNNEFGGCAKFSRAIRYTFPSLLNSLGDKRVGNRLLKAAKKINLGDGLSMRGYRAIALSKNKDFLKSFDLNENTPLESVIKMPYDLASLARNELSLTTEQFCAIDSLAVPKGASHFRFIVALGIVSDYIFDAISEGYQPVHEALNGINRIVYSDYIQARSIVNPQEITCTLPVTNLPDDVSAIQLVGIEFYQVVGTDFYPLGAGSALKIANVN